MIIVVSPSSLGSLGIWIAAIQRHWSMVAHTSVCSYYLCLCYRSFNMTIVTKMVSLYHIAPSENPRSSEPKICLYRDAGYCMYLLVEMSYLFQNLRSLQ